MVGYGPVGRKVTELLTDTGEQVCVIDDKEGPGVDVTGDVLDRAVLDQTPVASARAVILALGSDSATAFAAAVIRDYAFGVPIFAAVAMGGGADRIQMAGADFVIALSQVSGQLLAHHVLGETVSFQPRIKLVRVHPGGLVGRNPVAANIRKRTGCTIVAVDRGGELVMEFPPPFSIQPDDALFVCGTTDAVNRFYDEFPTSHL